MAPQNTCKKKQSLWRNGSSDSDNDSPKHNVNEVLSMKELMWMMGTIAQSVATLMTQSSTYPGMNIDMYSN